jgi:hypothetical protein
MPGQQRRKLKLVTELLRRVEAIGFSLYDLMPAQYLVVVRAEDAMHALHLETHYLSCSDSVGRRTPQK